MADMITWSGRGGISFFIKNNEIRGVKDIGISASVETEDITQGGETFVKKKNCGSYEITLTAVLNAAMGVDVQAVALEMTEAARCGDTGYFYTAGAKLLPSNFMCTSAQVNNVQLTNTGIWKSCEVDWTLKQCSKFDGSYSSGSSGSTKQSTAKKSTGTSKSKSEATGGGVNLGDALVSAVNGVIDWVNAAKKASAHSYSNLTSKTNQRSGGAGSAAKYLVR